MTNDDVALLKSRRLYGQIREALLAGEYQPGERLPARMLAERFKSSEIPVREALLMLQRDGLVEIAPNRGARVTSLNEAEIEENFVIRAHLEALATSTAADHVAESDLGDLERILDESERYLDDPVAFALNNQKFHARIFSISPYRRLATLIENQRAAQAMYATLFALVPSRSPESLREHRAIVEALRRGESDLAGQLAKHHKLRAAAVLTTALREKGHRKEAGL